MNHEAGSAGKTKLRYSPDYPPPDAYDPVIEAYKKDIDRTLLRENLKLTVEERIVKLESFMEFIHGLQAARRSSPLARENAG